MTYNDLASTLEITALKVHNAKLKVTVSVDKQRSLRLCASHDAKSDPSLTFCWISLLLVQLGLSNWVWWAKDRRFYDRLFWANFSMKRDTSFEIDDVFDDVFSLHMPVLGNVTARPTLRAPSGPIWAHLGPQVDPLVKRPTAVFCFKMGGRGGWDNSPLQSSDFSSELGGWSGREFPASTARRTQEWGARSGNIF